MHGESFFLMLGTLQTYSDPENYPVENNFPLQPCYLEVLHTSPHLTSRNGP